MAKKLVEVGVKDVVILEKAGAEGGSWFFNRFPGVGSDVIPHLYSFSFFPNPR